MTWNIDSAAVEAAALDLGLRKPVSALKVTIEQTKPDRTTMAKATTRPDGHVLLIGRHCTREEADHGLWHELCHCVQNEQMGREEYVVFYNLADIVLGYTNNPLELAAEEFATAHEHLTLTKEAS